MQIQSIGSWKVGGLRERLGQHAKDDAMMHGMR